MMNPFKLKENGTCVRTELVIKPLNEKSLVQAAKEYIIENDGASFAEINDLLVTKAMNEGFFGRVFRSKRFKRLCFAAF